MTRSASFWRRVSQQVGMILCIPNSTGFCIWDGSSLSLHWYAKRSTECRSDSQKNTVNLTSFDFGVLANVTGYHLSQLEDVDCFNFQASLVKPIRPPSQLAAFLRAEYPGATTFESSIEARLSGHGKVGRGDVVLADDGHGVVAAEVWALYAVDGAPRSLLSVWTKVSSSRDTSSAKWLRAHQPELWDIGDILCTCIYRDVGAEVLTLVPPAFVDRL